MQLTVGNLISSIKKKRVLALAIFLFSLVAYPVQYHLFYQNTSTLKVVLDNLRQLSVGNEVQAITSNLFTKKIMIKDDFPEDVKCRLAENREGYKSDNLECNLKKVSDSDLDKKKDELTKVFEDIYVKTLKQIKLYGKDISVSLNVNVNEFRKEITEEEIILYLDEEIINKKYLMIDFTSKENKFKFLKFFSYVVLINSLLISYLIITHPKLRL